MITAYVKAVRRRVHVWLSGATPGSQQYELVRMQFALSKEQMDWIYQHPH